MEEREFHNLDDLIADYERLQSDEGVEWDLSARLDPVVGWVAQLDGRGTDDVTDKELLRRAASRSSRLFWQYLLGMIVGVVLGTFLMVTRFNMLNPSLNFLWYLVALVFLVLLIAEGRRRGNLKKAQALFDEYPRLRELAVRDHTRGAVHRVDVTRIWSRPIELKRALRNLRIFERIKWAKHSDADQARSGHRLLPTIVFTFIPMTLNWERDGWVAFAVLLVGVSLVLFAFVMAVLGNSVRILLARSGPQTVSELVRLELEFPGMPTESRQEKEQAGNAESADFSDQMSWFAKNARRAGYRREPDYLMCLAMERPSMRWSVLCALLILFASYRVGAIANVSTFDIVSIGTIICWTLFHLGRVMRVDKVRAHFEKFARQNLSELELVDHDGTTVGLNDSGAEPHHPVASEV